MSTVLFHFLTGQESYTFFFPKGHLGLNGSKPVSITEATSPRFRLIQQGQYKRTIKNVGSGTFWSLPLPCTACGILGQLLNFFAPQCCLL